MVNIKKKRIILIVLLIIIILVLALAVWQRDNIKALYIGLTTDEEVLSEKLDAKIVMQVHDELVIEARDDVAELCAKIVKEEMEKVVKLSIPLTVDVTLGKNWLEQK